MSGRSFRTQNQDNFLTFVGHANLAGLTDYLRDILCLLNCRRDELLKLVAHEVTVSVTHCFGDKIPLTREIFTDCASACDKESFVL